MVDVRHHVLENILGAITPRPNKKPFVNLDCSVPGWVVVCEEVGEEVNHDNATLLGHHLQHIVGNIPGVLQIIWANATLKYFLLDHSDGHFFKTMEWSMVFEKKPL